MQETALTMARGLALTPANIERVAKKSSVEASRWAFEQWELRKKAGTKFAEAHDMLFVREALEQATHEAVAGYHASLFRPGALVVDMTAGIGADTIALANRGPVQAYELDEERAEMCRHNLAVHQVEIASVQVADSLTAHWTAEFAFADPARRVDKQRTLDPSQFSPNPVEVAERMQELELGAIKLSPMLPDEFLRSLGVGVEFVSYGNECREALVLLGTAATPGTYAIHLESGEKLSAKEGVRSTETVGSHIYDCDPALIRAHAQGSLADQYGLSILGDSIGYLTGEGFVSPWVKGFRVIESGRYDVAEIKALLRKKSIRTPVLKQNSAGLDLIKLNKALRLEGDHEGTLLFYRQGKSIRYVLAEPVKNT